MIFLAGRRVHVQFFFLNYYVGKLRFDSCVLVSPYQGICLDGTTVQ